MCKAKECKYYKNCIVKREMLDFKCSDYEKKQNLKKIQKLY